MAQKTKMNKTFRFILPAISSPVEKKESGLVKRNL